MEAGFSDSIETHRLWAQSLLKQADIEEASRESYSLLSAVLNRDPSWVIAHSHETFEQEEDANRFKDLCQRRSKHEPMAYLLGYRDFYNDRFLVEPGVLIPRPDTETMIDWVLEDHDQAAFKQGIDLCCGSGNIGISLSKTMSIPFNFLDCSTIATKVTHKNINALNLSHQSEVFQKDLCTDDLSTLGNYDLITMNPPYISRRDQDSLEADIIEFEPEIALFGGEDTGLEFLMACLPRLHDLAKPQCNLYVELGFNQHKLLKPKASYHGWLLEGWREDLGKIPRIYKWTKQLPNG